VGSIRIAFLAQHENKFDHVKAASVCNPSQFVSAQAKKTIVLVLLPNQLLGPFGQYVGPRLAEWVCLPNWRMYSRNERWLLDEIWIGLEDCVLNQDMRVRAAKITDLNLCTGSKGKKEEQRQGRE
jgi:hypothetical protein